ncbi:DUF7282 domain-containing protein [Natronorubrum aibiense]|uniref:DUF4179 domain-containing protein n=1 Tax=Natronorubrum aibiense TaxID=348826 RepID=A0A5P9P252_9EURY|nr:CARDB domain-containing protein [Natronorubrum aibiense]QFU82203.1 DUF4179 domain-containing protein [Natronorubrum aibiense]
MSSRVTFGTIKQVGAIVIAIAVVLAAGIVVGQAPAIFGVDEDPSASITFEDQQGDGESVVIDEVTLSDGGFVVITSSGDEPLVVSDYLESGTHEDVTIERGEAELAGRLTATVHRDTTNDETYTYEDSNGEEDQPYLENGFPVQDTAAVTTSEDGDALSDSFRVESLDAPDSATTNETINVTAEISNPTELETQQTVTFRIDGTALEQQTLTLGGGETREVTFEIDTTGTPPGEQTLGVYTDGDGALQPIELEFHTDPSVEAVDASDENVTVDVATPEDGFVAIEDGDGAVIATSDGLDAGEHEDVSVPFDDDVSVDDNQELTAVVYEGEPDDLENATVLEFEGAPVETTFTIADLTDEDDGGDNSE